MFNVKFTLYNGFSMGKMKLKSFQLLKHIEIGFFFFFFFPFQENVGKIATGKCLTRNGY